MKKKIIAVIILNLVLPLLFGGSFVYAVVSEVAGKGDLSPSVLALVVTGDSKQFQEDHWTANGTQGGVYDYNYIDEDGHGGSVVAEGRAIAGNNDYLFNFDLKKEGLGSLTFDFKQFRKYYDDRGGFFSSFGPSTYFVANRDLNLDIGDLKIEGVLSKDDSTKFTVSYEREYRQGSKSLISWGSVTRGSATRKIYPNYLDTHETVNRIDIKLEHTVNGIDIYAEQSYERIVKKDARSVAMTYNMNSGLFTTSTDLFEDLDSDIYDTVVRISKELNDKVFLSFDFLNSFYRANTRRTVINSGTSNYPMDPANVLQDTVVVLPRASISLSENLLMNVGLRGEYIKKSGGAQLIRTTTPSMATATEVNYLRAMEPEYHIGENIDLKYDGIKDVIFYTGAEFQQEWRNINEASTSTGTGASVANIFDRNSQIDNYEYDTTSGFKWYPMPKADVTAEIKARYSSTGYDNSNNRGDITGGYIAFIDGINYTSYSPLVKFNYKPLKWLTCNFRYEFNTRVYSVQTRVADAWEHAKYRANIYSTGVTVTPREYLYGTVFYEYKQASSETQANGDGGPVQRVPTYNSSFRTLSASISYSPYKDITLRGGYSLSMTNNFDNFILVGLPLGLTNLSQDASFGFEKKIRGDCSVEFKYDFMQYGAPSIGGINDYEAHLFYTGLKMKF